MKIPAIRRRTTLAALGAALLASSLGAAAQGQDEPVVKSVKIIEALSSKDVVLDRPDPAGRPSAARPDPSINLQVQFSFDSADLLPQGKRQLDELAMAFNHDALLQSRFVLAGHTDRVGDADYNLRLSHARADAVRAYLASAHGVSSARLQTIGYGFSRLLDPAQPAAAINRRVEIRRLAGGALARPVAEPGTGGRLVPTSR